MDARGWNFMDKKHLKMTLPAKEFVSKKIDILMKKEGFPQQKAIAAAYSMARKKGFKVPKYPIK
jgi:hypothetical protein